MKQQPNFKAFEEDEEDRIKELHTFEFLDAAPEKEFQELLKLAGQICEVSLSAIVFIDKERQWFKAKLGDPLPETKRIISLCAYTILSDEPLIIQDTTKDSRFKENPDFIEGSKIRFYAGVSIYSSKKKRLGVVCIMDQNPRTVSSAQIAALNLISSQVSYLLELRIQNKIMDKYSIKAQQARSEERDLLGQELHDNINQILAGIKLFLELAEKYEGMRLK